MLKDAFSVFLQLETHSVKVFNVRLRPIRDRHLSCATAARARQQLRPSTAALLSQQCTAESATAAFPETSFSKQNEDGGPERGPVDGHESRGDNRRQHRLHGAHEMADATNTTPARRITKNRVHDVCKMTGQGVSLTSAQPAR